MRDIWDRIIDRKPGEPAATFPDVMKEAWPTYEPEIDVKKVMDEAMEQLSKPPGSLTFVDGHDLQKLAMLSQIPRYAPNQTIGIGSAQMTVDPDGYKQQKIGIGTQQAAQSPSFKKGDVVTIKGQDLALTVVEQVTAYGPYVTVVWFDQAGHLHRDAIDGELLERYQGWSNS